MGIPPNVAPPLTATLPSSRCSGLFASRNRRASPARSGAQQVRQRPARSKPCAHVRSDMDRQSAQKMWSHGVCTCLLYTSRRG